MNLEDVKDFTRQVPWGMLAVVKIFPINICITNPILHTSRFNLIGRNNKNYF